MVTYRCFICEGLLVEDVVVGWHWCPECDVEYSKLILQPMSVAPVEPEDSNQ